MDPTEQGTLVVSRAFLQGMREMAQVRRLKEVEDCIDGILDYGTTVNLPAHQLAAIAETLRPIVETDWQERRQEADLTPSGVNGG
jgi:hypothetical protein